MHRPLRSTKPPLGVCRRTFCRGLLGIVGFAGCAPWKAETPPSTRGLPEAKLPASASVLEVIFWPLPDPTPESLDQTTLDQVRDPLAILLKATDELAIPLERRQRLQQNGLRAGRIDHVDQLIDEIGLPLPSDAGEKLMQDAALATETEQAVHRVPFRPGQQRDFAVRQVASGVQSIFLHGEPHSTGRSLQEPQFLFSVAAEPLIDRRVRVRLVPRIEHGPFRQSFVSNEQAIRLNRQRDRWLLSELALEAELRRNQALILMPTRQPFGLGERMLVDQSPDGRSQRTVVLVRLARPPEPEL